MSLQTASRWRCFDSAVVGKREALARKHTWGFCLWIPSQASEVRTTLTVMRVTTQALTTTLHPYDRSAFQKGIR